MRSVVTPRNKLFGLINFYTLLGLVCFGTTVLNLVFILQRMPLNVVIAFLSIQYVAVTFAGYFILGEKISKTRWIGISLIAFGITVVSTTYA
jgi:undecaprenyl phosphate-alpha-L-ara4N flippase subunit ArnE